MALPAQSRLLDTDVLWVIVGLCGIVTAVWVVDGGYDLIAKGWSSGWRAAASLSGIWTSLAAMVGIVLSSRIGWLERAVGLDRLLTWHRIAGDTMGVLLGIHIVASVEAEMPWRGGFINTVKDLTGREPYFALTTFGAALIGIVVVSSLRSVRNRLAYETWYFLHLTAYIGVAASFSHQITTGSLLSNVQPVRYIWVTMSVGILAVAILTRWSSVIAAARNPLTIADIREVAPHTVAITLTGRALRTMRGDAGQFVMLRTLKPGQWWKVNPYSLSAAPTTRSMRLTIKDRGDASAATLKLRVGDRMAVEGPYGITTPEVFADHRPLFIGGGVGVTPIRAMLERLPRDSRPIVLLRARTEKEIPHLAEITALARERGGETYTVLGRTAALKSADPFSAAVLRRAVPDLDERAALVCGPNSLMFAARAGLRDAGMPLKRIHLELPWW